jgi:transcriptional regulator with XRE-family HTH domain
VTPSLVHDLGSYLREQRMMAQLSLRQLSERAGISNPYLSQIERGLKKPSAEILQQIARGLQVSAESLYVRAGILEEAEHGGTPTVLTAIAQDPRLTARQREVLVEVYRSFVDTAAPTQPHPPTARPADRAAPGRKAPAPRRTPAAPAATPTPVSPRT